MAKPATHLASILMGIFSFGQLWRALFGAQVRPGEQLIPMWVSWVLFLLAGALAVMLWREARTKS